MASKKENVSRSAPSITLAELSIIKGWVDTNGLFKVTRAFAATALAESPHIDAIETFEFCYSQICAELKSSGFQGSETATGRLVDVLGENVVTRLEKHLCSYLLSLPNSYWFFFYCPQLNHSQLGLRRLNDDIFTIECLERDRGVTLSSLLGITKFSESDCAGGIPHGFHFRIASVGHSGGEYLNSASVAAVRKLKHLLVGLVIEKKIAVGHSRSAFGDRDGRMFVVDRHNPSKAQEVELPEGFRRFLGKIVLPTDPERDTKQFADILGVTPEVENVFIQAVSVGLSVLLDTSEMDDDVDCLRTSSEWLFDAKLNEDDPSLKVMQLAAAAEAVLAEGKRIEREVTRTLSDRCAYLLGFNAQRRANIRKGFSEFYNIRSSLVHGRSRTLSQKDKGLVIWAEHIIESIIEKETRFLARKK